MTAGPSAAAVLARVTARLQAADVPNPEVDAALLLAHVTGWSRARLRLAGEEPLAAAVAAELEALVVRREAREPVQLLLGSVGFRYLDIVVRPGVFIPRPETETLAGAAIERLPEDGALVLEPCTGTGAVACAVATEAGARVIATDVSPKAVDLARHNAAVAVVADPDPDPAAGAGGVAVRGSVEVLAGDLLEPVSEALRGAVHVIVSNPPYVADDELDGLDPEVLDWDPRRALVSGATGHEISDRLIAVASYWLRPGGWLLMEVDAARAVETADRCRAAGYAEAAVIVDLAGRDRVVVARRPPR